MDKATLLLADGSRWEGRAIGDWTEPRMGELVFTTGMGGYLETLSDPSYYGQIILQTFPLVGNYGFIPADLESPGIAARGYVVRSLCDAPSNFRSEGTVEDFLRRQHIPGLEGVDTRALTIRLREAGVMNAVLTKEPDKVDLSQLAAFRVTDAVKSVSRAVRETLPALGEQKRRVALMDYGAKGNIARELQKRGCEVTVLPYDTSAEDVLALRPDGVMLSNGPGDPAEKAA